MVLKPRSKHYTMTVLIKIFIEYNDSTKHESSILEYTYMLPYNI